jgi:heat shock protein HslJ
LTRLLLAVLLAGLTLIGCSAAPDTSDPGGGRPAGLAGTAWRVVAVGARVPAAGAEPTIVFADGAMSGSGGCNHFGGQYRYDPATGHFKVNELGMTAMGCLEPGRNEMEAAFLQALGGATAVGLDDAGRLLIAGPGGPIVLVPDGAATPGA